MSMPRPCGGFWRCWAGDLALGAGDAGMVGRGPFGYAQGLGQPGTPSPRSSGQDPHSGNLYIFRGRRSDLIKVIWHDGQGMCLFAKRLERGRVIWPSPADGVVAISAGQMGYFTETLESIPRQWKVIQTVREKFTCR